MDNKIIELVKNQNKIEPAALLAFISVETGGNGFDKKTGKILIQFEPAWFKKQELDIDNCYWIADRIGEILSVNEQYYFNFNDIRFDVDNNMKDGLIFRWQDECIENNLKINYENYIKWKTN